MTVYVHLENWHAGLISNITVSAMTITGRSVMKSEQYDQDINPIELASRVREFVNLAKEVAEQERADLVIAQRILDLVYVGDILNPEGEA